MRPTIIAGNWKLNPPPEGGHSLIGELRAGLAARSPLPTWLAVVVCPPSPYLGAFASGAGDRTGDEIDLGAQDLSPCGWGAHTGEVSAELLAGFGCRYSIVGHSERRHQRGETDGEVARKAVAALAAGLIPIVCVGETEHERDAGETYDVVERQLLRVLEETGERDRCVIAYEPVWAIGTGRTASPEQAAEVHRFLRTILDRMGRDGAGTAILYGGSVQPQNAAGLLEQEDIDGALVGGASLEAESFLAIIDAARETRPAVA